MFILNTNLILFTIYQNKIYYYYYLINFISFCVTMKNSSFNSSKIQNNQKTIQSQKTNLNNHQTKKVSKINNITSFGFDFSLPKLLLNSSKLKLRTVLSSFLHHD